jgi:O-antigen ligase
VTQPAHTGRAALSPPASRAGRDRRLDWWRADSRVESEVPAATHSRPPGSAVPFWGLMSFTFILLLAPQTFIPELAALRIALVAAAATMASHLLDCFIRRQPFLVLTTEMSIAGCLVGWALLTAPLSYWPGGSVFFLLDFYLKTLAIFWLLGSVVNSTMRLRRVAWGLSLMGVPLAATAVNHFYSGAFMEGARRIVGYNAPLTGNPNDLALMLNLILPLAVALFLIHRRPLARAILLPIVVLDIVAVVMTFSRAGFVTLATILATYLGRLLRRPQRGLALVALLLLLTSIALVPPGYLDRLQTITDIEADSTGSAQARWNDTFAAIRWVLAHPILGSGIGTNAVALNEERGPYWTVIHNVYLQFAVELGLPGLILFLLLLVRSIKNATFVQRRSAPEPSLRTVFHLAEGVQTGLIAFAVAGLFSPVAYHFYFYYLAGLAVAVKAAYHAEAGLSPATSTPISLGRREP